jgi:hypothetical protein
MSALRSRFGTRVLAVLLALLFVCPPEAAARVSCATLAMLSVPMRCCASRSSGLGAEASRRPCCCALESDRSAGNSEKRTSSLANARVKSPDGCGCAKSATTDSNASSVSGANGSALASWIAERAHVSARALHFDSFVVDSYAPSAWRGPPGSLAVLGAERARAPAAGCTRHELLARGIAGLLTDFGVALL